MLYPFKSILKEGIYLGVEWVKKCIIEDLYFHDDIYKTFMWKTLFLFYKGCNIKQKKLILKFTEIKLNFCLREVNFEDGYKAPLHATKWLKTIENDSKHPLYLKNRSSFLIRKFRRFMLKILCFTLLPITFVKMTSITIIFQVFLKNCS